MNPFLFHILDEMSCSTPVLTAILKGVEEICEHLIICNFRIYSEGTSLHSQSPLHSIDPPLQEAHLTPTAPMKGQSPGLTNRGQNQVLLEDQGLNPLPGEDQGLAVLDTAVATDISPGHTLPDPGNTGTIYIQQTGQSIA